MDHCPIVRSYLRGIKSDVDFSLAINDSYKDSYDDLVQLAETAGGARARQHQRAFFCIEIMTCCWHWSGVPLLSVPPYSSFRRSREGLNKVLARLKEDEEDLTAENVEFSFCPTRDAQMWSSKIREERLKLLALAREAIITLRVGLKNPQISLGPIGTTLAEAGAGKRIGLAERLHIARELLDQTEGNAKRAWAWQQANPDK